MALDAPEHGDRITDPAAAAEARQHLESRLTEGGGFDPSRMRRIEEKVPHHVVDWRALLDDLQRDERWAAGPFGWWGVSMGTRHGLPLLAEEPRLKAAVLGLFGLRPEASELRRMAGAITVPVLFVFQWDDELMTRQSGLDLWDALGSRDKSMHVNPGGHIAIPAFEVQAFEDFFARALLER